MLIIIYLTNNTSHFNKLMQKLFCDYNTVDSTIANHLEVNRYYFKHGHGNVILFGTKNILHSQLYRKIIILVHSIS